MYANLRNLLPTLLHHGYAEDQLETILEDVMREVCPSVWPLELMLIRPDVRSQFEMAAKAACSVCDQESLLGQYRLGYVCAYAELKCQQENLVGQCIVTSILLCRGAIGLVIHPPAPPIYRISRLHHLAIRLFPISSLHLNSFLFSSPCSDAFNRTEQSAHLISLAYPIVPLGTHRSTSITSLSLH
jgi:hypothetical protein